MDTRLLLNLADDLQGKPENPDRHGTRRSAIGRDGTRRTSQPLNQAENAHSGDTIIKSQNYYRPAVSSYLVRYVKVAIPTNLP